MILVTGAGGTVGSVLVQELQAVGHKPRVAYHSQHKAETAKRDGYDAVLLDFAEPKTLGPALEGANTVFLLGTGGRGQSEQEINVLNAAKVAGVKRLVKLSVWGAAEEQFSLARIHRAVEQATEASALSWTFLRPNGFMQNFVNHMAGTIKSQGAIYQPAGDAKISHIDVRDIAKVAARVLTTPGHEGKVYELSGPQALSYGEAASALSRVLNRQISYVPLSDDAARAGMLAAGMPDFYADYLLDLYRFYRSGGGSQVTHDVKNITGREPIAFDKFVRDHAHAFG